MATFARIRIPGQLLGAVICVLTKVMVAMGETRPLVVANGLCGVVSLPLLFGLVWGAELGVVGAAIAFTASDLIACLLLITAAMRTENCRKCWGGFTRDALRGWPSYLKLALPSLLMVVCEEWSWDVVTFLAGLCTSVAGGPRVPKRRLLAAQGWLSGILNVIYSISGPVGRGIGTVVGNSLGGGQPLRAQSATRVGVAFTAFVMLGISGALVGTRGLWGAIIPHRVATEDQLYSGELSSGEVSEAPSISAIMVQLLPYNAVFVWADGMQMALTGAITGAGVQERTSPLLFVAYWLLGLPLGCMWAFAWPSIGLLGIWLGMLLAVYVHMAAFLLICFGQPYLSCAIEWQAATRHAEERVATDADRDRDLGAVCSNIAR